VLGDIEKQPLKPLWYIDRQDMTKYWHWGLHGTKPKHSSSWRQLWVDKLY